MLRVCGPFIRSIRIRESVAPGKREEARVKSRTGTAGERTESEISNRELVVGCK